MFYVDDVIIIGNSPILIQEIITKLHETFSFKQLFQVDYFLGLEIKCLPNKYILMMQTKYVCDLLNKTHMAKAHSVSSPIVSNCKLSKLGA